MLGHLHFFAENRPSSISPSPLPLSMLYQWAESALFRSNIDQGGGGTSLCANATIQSIENRAISEHVSYFQAVPRTFVQDCSYPHAHWACFAALADHRGSVASYCSWLLCSPPPSPLVSMFLASLHWFSSVTVAVVLGSHRVAMDTASVGHYCIWWPFQHHAPNPRLISR